MFISNVCRAELSNEVLSTLKAGMNVLTPEQLAPRQLRILDTSAEFPATVKPHRGQMITTIDPEVAISMVDSGSAEFCEQKALVYSMADYLADVDVKRDGEECMRAEKADEEGETLVLVAICGDNRSSLAVCRNIVSGCQNMEKLIDDAKGALEATGTFLIEE